MNFPFQQIVRTEEETIALAKSFAEVLKEGNIICLNGNLGSGKTFFVKAVCSAFGIETASSPSFALVNEYHGQNKIIHFDFYRIKNEEELSDIGFEQYLSDGDSIIFIEWANLFPTKLPKKYLLIEFSIINNFERSINITKHE